MKTFRVHLAETQTFYCDIPAETEHEAIQFMQDALVGINDMDALDIIEDNSGYTGYQVEQAEELTNDIE